MQSTKERPQNAFGTLLKHYRTQAGISQEALAEFAQLSVETISSLERGVRRSPYRDTVALLANALSLAPAERDELVSAAQRPASPRALTAIRPTVRPVRGPSGNLPFQLTSFVGRKENIAAICTSLQSHRLVTMTGTGGVGKTRIALEVAATVAADKPDGAWFAEFAALTDQGLVAGAIAAAMRYRLPSDGDDLDALTAMLASKTLVLLLDNCEHVIGAVQAVAARLLARCPGITLIATSRQALRISGEATFRVPTLDTADACALFLDRARIVEPDFSISEQTEPIVADICRQLDGIPLAIELAASRAGVLSLSDLRDRLDQRFRLLAGGNAAAMPRQQALRALIDWSYDLLDESERQLFRRVAVFAGGFTLEAATAVCAERGEDDLDVLERLASLVDKSLIVAAVDGNETRYGLLESMRLYALEQLTASGERRVLETRHLAYYSGLMLDAERAYEQNGSDAALACLSPELENLRIALHHSIFSGHGADASLAVATARLFPRLGLRGEGLAWLEAAQDIVAPDDVHMQSRVWNAIGYLVGNTGGARAHEASARAVECARASGDRELIAWVLTQYAVAAMDQGRQAQAESALEEASILFGDAPLPHQRARILAVRLHLARCSGDTRPADEFSLELATLHRRLGNHSGEMRTLVSYAENLHASGATEKAIAVVREALPRCTEDRDTHGIALLNLTAYLTATGEAGEAIGTGTQAIEVLVSSGTGSGAVTSAIGHLALAFALDGDVERAARLLGYWDASRRELGVEREYTEGITYERLLVLLAHGLEPAQRDVLLVAGARLTSQEAIGEALRR